MTESALKTQIIEAMKAAMRAQQKADLQTIRLITAAIKQKEVDERIILSDADVLSILDKMLKQRRESIRQYQLAERSDLVAQEQFEIEIIQTFLPERLSDLEIQSLVDAALLESGAKTPQQMGQVMAILKPKLQGRADVAAVSQSVKLKLQGDLV